MTSPHTMHQPPSYSPASSTAEPVILPPSFAQELFWLMDRASVGGAVYNVPRTRRVVGTLDLAALRRALEDLVARHEILRTTYATHEDQCVQVVHPSAALPFRFVDLRTLPGGERDAAARRLVEEAARTPFNLASDVLLRALVVQTGDDEYVLHLDSHHIAFDGWSRDVMFRDLSALYTAHVTGATPNLPELPIQYADYAIWQREQLTGAALEDLLGYWRKELGGADFVLEIPTDFPRPAVPGSEAVTARLSVADATRQRIRDLATRHGATTYMVLLAAYMTVLHRYTGQPDVLVGSPIAGRERPETEGLIGYFANTIVQRGRFAADPTFSDLLAQVRESALGAHDHQQVPFEKLVLELQGGQHLSHSPLFQVVFTMLGGTGESRQTLGALPLTSFGAGDSATKFDITFFMNETPDSLVLMARGRAELYREETMARLLGHIAQVLESAAADPTRPVSALKLLTDEELRALALSNETATALGEPASVVDLFERAAARVPERVAVYSGERQLSYADVEARANQLARELRARGVVAGGRVGIALDRSVEVVVAILAVLKTGAAYVPLLPEVPVARLAQQTAEGGVRVVVTVGAYAERFAGTAETLCLDRDATAIEAHATQRLATDVSPESAAYVLFTSGSTGVPKGVVVSHANVVHYTRAISRVLGDVPRSSPGDGLAALDGWHFALVSTLGADLGNTCLFPALASGGTLHVLPQEVATQPAAFAGYMRAHSVDVLKITPSHLRALVSASGGIAETAAMLPARWLVLGGESLSWDFAAQLTSAVGLAGGCRILNHYGPTETTVGCSTFEVTAASGEAARKAGAQTVPIGRPLANTTLHVLDSYGAPVPEGVAGELYVGGDGVTLGYAERPDLTAERFVTLPGIGRTYRTGDRVRRLPHGVVEFLGRRDDQVKIRGYRVELGEIEQLLLQHPAVAQGAVVLTAREDGVDPVIVAYAVSRASSSGYGAAHTTRADESVVRAWLAERLPEYMVPDRVVMIEQLPLTPSGKVDRRALPALESAGAAAEQVVAPRTPTEAAIAAIWCEVLKRGEVGVTQNFITLGGHSLLAIRVLGKLSRQFGVRLPLRTLFDAPTVESLAELVDVETRLAALANMSDEEAARLLSGQDEPA